MGVRVRWVGGDARSWWKLGLGLRAVREKGAERNEEREVWREGGGRGVLKSEFGFRKRGGVGGQGM